MILRVSLLLLSLAIPVLAEEPAPPIDPERVCWVAEHAVAVRSIDPVDEDFSDLMPLVQTIGKARVVQLGGFIGEADKEEPVVPGALEALLHAAGRPGLFLDLAHLPTDHWLRTPWTASFYFHEPQPSTWTRVYDGVFFLDVEKPTTPPPK